MVTVTTTTTNQSSSSSIPLGVGTFKLSNGNQNYDEKYRKRRKQQKQQRLRQTFMLMGAAIIVLVFTWWSLKDEDSADIAFERTHNHPKLNRNSFQDLRKLQSDMKRRKENKLKNQVVQLQDDGGGNEDDGGNNAGGGTGDGGFFGGMKKMFTKTDRQKELESKLADLDTKIATNSGSGIRWVEPGLLPALRPTEDKPQLHASTRLERANIKTTTFAGWDPSIFFKVRRLKHLTSNDVKRSLQWMDNIKDDHDLKGPKVDYTKHQYEYPTPKLMEPPETLGDYPKLVPFKELMLRWPQDDIDNPPTPFVETLIHFDYNKVADMEAAKLFRDAKLPFKFVNVPEVIDAGSLWTDEYLSYQFDDRSARRKYPPAHGTCQESSDNFFAFYAVGNWPVERMGVPPTRNNDWTFKEWSKHARYADSIGLNFDKPHFYWQSGVDKQERYQPSSEWSFISRDLPSFSSRTETDFVFNPNEQKGIQCRFGERGVSAATHFDSGRNMIAMMTGAKRYILSPPKECSKLGIVNNRGNSIFRHSMLNFGHFSHMDNPNMPVAEREWLERAGNAMALDTVLKAGEVLYIPSHWFHYITSLQKSAQCNVRSGIDVEGDDVFGGRDDVTDLCEPEFKLHNQDGNGAGGRQQRRRRNME